MVRALCLPVKGFAVKGPSAGNKPLQTHSPQPPNPNGRDLFIGLMDKTLITFLMCGHYLQWQTLAEIAPTTPKASMAHKTKNLQTLLMLNFTLEVGL